MNLSASQAVIRDVCAKFGVQWSEVRGPRHSHRLMPPRREIARRLRAMGLTTTIIGRIMGKDHSTVIKSYLREDGA